MTRNRDVLGATLRFIPGAIFGAIIGVWLVVAVSTPVLFFAGVLACASIGGLASIHFGIRFWEALRHLRWFPF